MLLVQVFLQTIPIRQEVPRHVDRPKESCLVCILRPNIRPPLPFIPPPSPPKGGAFGHPEMGTFVQSYSSFAYFARIFPSPLHLRGAFGHPKMSAFDQSSSYLHTLSKYPPPPKGRHLVTPRWVHLFNLLLRLHTLPEYSRGGGMGGLFGYPKGGNLVTLRWVHSFNPTFRLYHR